MRRSFTAFLLATKPNLQAQDISHGLGGFFLCRGGDMGIGVQGEASGEVTQHAGYSLDVHAVLQGDGGEGVTEVMESDLRDTTISTIGQARMYWTYDLRVCWKTGVKTAKSPCAATENQAESIS